MFKLDFSKIPEIPKKEKTLLEIGKYPHYENVISNYLQFFINPSNNHNFDDLLLTILFSFYGKSLSDFSSENLLIQREVSTDKGRIDLLIIGSDFVVVIENKIFHHVANPLEDYKVYLDKNYDDFEKIGLVLSLKKESLKDNFFINITYEDIIAEVKKWLQKNYNKANSLYDLFFLDMIKSIENLMKKKDLDIKLLDYLSDNKEEITKLNQSLDKYNKVIFNKMKLLDKTFDSLDTENLVTSKKIWNQNWITEKLENLLHIKVNKSKFNDATINIKIRISPKRWSIEFWDLKLLSKKVEGILDDKSVDGFKISKDKKSKRITCQTYPFDTDIKEVCNDVLEILKLIKANL